MTTGELSKLMGIFTQFSRTKEEKQQRTITPAVNPTVAGQGVNTVLFKFFETKLMSIFVATKEGNGPGRYSAIKSAYVAKYGAPKSTEPTQYQNGFGATLAGEDLQWEAGNYSLTVSDDHGNLVAIYFLDSAAATRQKNLTQARRMTCETGGPAAASRLR